MFSIQHTWKEFRVHLPSLHALVQQNADVTKYCGMSADNVLTLHFEEPVVDGLILADLEDIWSGLTEEGEAAKFKLDADRAAAVETARESLLTADFDSLIPAERKLLLGLPLSAQDCDALIVKQGV